LGLDQLQPDDEFSPTDWDVQTNALVIVTVWIIGFFVVHQFVIRARALGNLLPQVGQTYSVNMLLSATLFTTFLGLLLTGIFVIQTGSVGAFMYAVKIEKAFAGSYVIREISVVGAIFCTLSLFHFEKQYRAGIRRKVARKMVWICLALLLINLAGNYAWGNRYNVALIFLAFMIAWHFQIRALNWKKIAILLLLAAIALQGLKVMRIAAVSGQVGFDVGPESSFWRNVSTSLHAVQYDALVLALRDAGERFPFRNGRDFKNGLVAWIPRSLYPAKETFQVGGWFRRVYQPDKVNGWPMTIVGAWYVNFATWGIVFGVLASGILVGVFDANYRNLRGSLWQGVIAPMLAFFLFSGGGVGAGFLQNVVFYLVPIAFLAFLLKRRRSSF
jgi:oligosaccharide repeat unit polymerase